ncbi:pseudouridine synthase [Ferruginibacter lapsinanis]|uniref:pseudouridine synthase n=1 Tax=Ferruginibacter lapsinanis TaxID=563172 RepID=UPI001E3E9D83|nr:pseudouridine synthase [Ferruginibacter lapsinanis]UEG51027.1 pseudouridine synthase [Ferruginibacter lapsinanis]
MQHRYFIVYKPFNVLCQFSAQEGKQTLKDHFKVPKDVYPVGRLDYDSEGLLIFTNDKELNNRLLNPAYKHKREYWVQVDGAITNEAIANLQNGVVITIDGKWYSTKKCTAAICANEPAVPERTPPIRFRKNIPTSWIKINLTEGKNRQVRKMTAAVGFPTLRLIRHSIEKCTVKGLMPGEMKEISKNELFKMLFDLPD